ERVMGLEPTTATLATWRSTTELHPRSIQSSSTSFGSTHSDYKTEKRNFKGSRQGGNGLCLASANPPRFPMPGGLKAPAWLKMCLQMPSSSSRPARPCRLDQITQWLVQTRGSFRSTPISADAIKFASRELR